MTAAWPDIEAVVVDYLTAQLPGVFVCLELPPTTEFQARLPIVQITRIGGPSDTDTWGGGPLLDRPIVDLNVYATLTTTQTALQICNTVLGQARAAMTDIQGLKAAGAGVVSVRETVGPGPRPDPSQPVVRRGFTAQLTVRPVAA